jgi:hypothetical protein
MKKIARKPSSPRESNVVASLPVRGHRVGRVVGVDAEGLFLVECVAGGAPISARTTLQLTPRAQRDAAASRQEALIVFESEAADRPIVVGLLAQPVPNGFDRVADATVDGRRVVLEGQDEIVLRCGEASITLRRNGRVVIRGAYVETRSQGVNRIKGGSVQIN